MRLLFAGTPAAALAPLRALLASRHEVVAVLTRPATAAGRGRSVAVSPVEQEAAAHGIPVLSPTRVTDPQFLDRLAQLAPDCCPVVAYGALLREPALSMPRHGWVNLHFSLLPAWRGAAPVQRAVLAGDEITGASTFRIEAGLDTGPVFGVVTEPIRPNDTSGTLLERLARSGADLLVATMDGIEDGTLRPVAQAADGVSTAAKLEVADARIDWAAPGRHVERLVRACTPAPGAWTMFRDDRLKLGPAQLLTGPVLTHQLGPGELAVTKREVMVGTGTDPVRLGTVQAPGRRPVPAADWARGVRPAAGERLG